MVELTVLCLASSLLYIFYIVAIFKRTVKVGVPKKVVPTRISANVSVSNKSIV
jgi:hypothetical protein